MVNLVLVSSTNMRERRLEEKLRRINRETTPKHATPIVDSEGYELVNPADIEDIKILSPDEYEEVPLDEYEEITPDVAISPRIETELTSKMFAAGWGGKAAAASFLYDTLSGFDDVLDSVSSTYTLIFKSMILGGIATGVTYIPHKFSERARRVGVRLKNYIARHTEADQSFGLVEKYIKKAINALTVNKYVHRAFGWAFATQCAIAGFIAYVHYSATNTHSPDEERVTSIDPFRNAAHSSLGAFIGSYFGQKVRNRNVLPAVAKAGLVALAVATAFEYLQGNGNTTGDVIDIANTLGFALYSSASAWDIYGSVPDKPFNDSFPLSKIKEAQKRLEMER